MVDKNSGGIFWEQGVPASHQIPQAQGARKISPHNLWLQKAAGIESVEETSETPSSSSSRTHTQTHLLRLWAPAPGRWLEGHAQGEAEVSGIKTSRGHRSFPGPSTHRAGRLVPYLRSHQPGLGGPQRLHLTYRPTQPDFPYEQTSNSWPQ